MLLHLQARYYYLHMRVESSVKTLIVKFIRNKCNSVGAPFIHSHVPRNGETSESIGNGINPVTLYKMPY